MKTSTRFICLTALVWQMALPPSFAADGSILSRYNEPDVRVDGELSESIWQDIPGRVSMSVIRPDLLTEPRYRTVTQLFYSNEGLYVGITADQPPDTLLPRLSARDKRMSRDGVVLYLDTSGEGRYGFMFGVNLGDSLVDGTILAERQESRLWDGAWYGASSTTDTGYTVEMFLPWSMMAMPNGEQKREIGYFVQRRVAHLDEEWGWPALASTDPTFLSAFERVEVEAVNPRAQFAWYPFTAATVDNMHDESDLRVGTDVFWKPSSSFQVLATLNPDFGAVESDDVVVNLTAFETYFPEKRLFFLEGNEVFITTPRADRSSGSTSTGARRTPSSFFLEPTTLFNTRRIGGPARRPEVPDDIDIPGAELGKPTELLGAVKLVSEAGQHRFGLMMASEDDTVFRGIDQLDNPVTILQTGRDFGVLRWSFDDVSQGRRGIGWMSTITSHDETDALTHGLDLHYRNPSGSIRWDTQFMASDVDSVMGYGGVTDLYYFPDRGRMHKFTLDYLDENLDVSDLGFIRRNDEMTMRYTHNRIDSGMEGLRQVTNTLSLSYVTNTDYRVTRPSVWYSNTLTFNDKSRLGLTGMFVGKHWDDTTSRGNGLYRVDETGLLEVTYGTDTSRRLSTSVGVSASQEDLGDVSTTIKGGLTYKPSDRLSFDLDVTWRDANHWLIYAGDGDIAGYDAIQWQPKIAMELFLSARQQLRLSSQWVGIKARARTLYGVPTSPGALEHTTSADLSDYDFTISRLTTQLRYRWEIAPLSDLFLVYTRGGNLPSDTTLGFSNLFHDALTDPVIDFFVMKLRYRLGN